MTKQRRSFSAEFKCEAAALACDAKRKTERTQQGLTVLQSKGLIRIDGGYVWLV